MDIYLEDKLIHRESLESFTTKCPNSIISFLSKISEDDINKIYRFNMKLSKSPDRDITYDSLRENIEFMKGLYCNLQQVKVNKLNKYIIELDIIGLIPDIIGFLMVCDIPSFYLDLLDTIETERIIVRLLMDISHERIDSYMLNRAFIIRYLMEFNKMESYKSTFDILSCLNNQTKRNIIDEVCNRIYGFSMDELLKVDKDNIDKLSIENIDATLLGKISKYVEDKYE
jgi:hypothetical protein